MSPSVVMAELGDRMSTTIGLGQPRNSAV